MPTTLSEDTPPALNIAEPGANVCDHLFKSIGARLHQMTRRQYGIYGELLGEMSAVMTGRGETETDGSDAAWDHLSKRARGLLLAIESNAPEADVRPYSSFDEAPVDAHDLSDDALSNTMEESATEKAA
jgi:hypothetical protein